MNDYNKLYPASMTFYEMTDLLRHILEKDAGSGAAKICTALNTAWNDMCSMHSTALDRANNSDNMNKYYEAKLMEVRNLCDSALNTQSSVEMTVIIGQIREQAHE